jgi:hypothetical protein
VRNALIHRLARRELHLASRRYRAVSLRTEQRFRHAVEQLLEGVAENAELYSPYREKYRWAKSARFPYILYFEILDSMNLIVYAVGHERRRPGYWKRRITRA